MAQLSWFMQWVAVAAWVAVAVAFLAQIWGASRQHQPGEES
jgi:hypothetical protein